MSHASLSGTSRGGSVVSGALLVAGTCIGGGMLALPVLTSLGGFIPSLALYFLCWLFMAGTALLYLEACLWLEGTPNIVSLARHALGKGGEAVAWVVYLFLFYCLTTAYVTGCGGFVTSLFGEGIPHWLGSIVFVMVVAPVVYRGARAVDRVNLVLMVGLGCSYVLLLVQGLPHVKLDLLKHASWPLSLVALPIFFTSFAFQGIVPSLTSYLKRDPRKVRLAILWGSVIPLFVYAIWEGLILGIVPTYGPGSLFEALEAGANAIQPLKTVLGDPMIYIAGEFFALFALVTSFLGVTLGLLDFLADGLKVKKEGKGKLVLCLLVFIPPTALAMTSTHIFLSSLGLAGGYGVAMLLGVLPILIVWAGRYKHGFKSPYHLGGGRISLTLLMVFVLFELGLELSQLLK